MFMYTGCFFFFSFLIVHNPFYSVTFVLPIILFVEISKQFHVLKMSFLFAVILGVSLYFLFVLFYYLVCQCMKYTFCSQDPHFF